MEGKSIAQRFIYRSINHFPAPSPLKWFFPLPCSANIYFLHTLFAYSLAPFAFILPSYFSFLIFFFCFHYFPFFLSHPTYLPLKWHCQYYTPPPRGKGDVVSNIYIGTLGQRYTRGQWEMTWWPFRESESFGKKPMLFVRPFCETKFRYKLISGYHSKNAKQPYRLGVCGADEIYKYRSIIGTVSQEPVLFGTSIQADVASALPTTIISPPPSPTARIGQRPRKKMIVWATCLKNCKLREFHQKILKKEEFLFIRTPNIFLL